MIAAILTIILLNPAGAEVKVPPKDYASIISCERAAAANTKAIARQTGWKIKSATCVIAAN